MIGKNADWNMDPTKSAQNSFLINVGGHVKNITVKDNDSHSELEDKDLDVV